MVLFRQPATLSSAKLCMNPGAATVDNGGGQRACLPLPHKLSKGKSFKLFASAKNKWEFMLTSRWSSSNSRSLVSQAAVQDDPDACDDTVTMAD
jgi:hypothetical protein